MIEDYGYKGIEMKDQVDAVNKFKLNKDKIELLLSDVMMPHKNGREAYEERKEIKPYIKALFISGNPADIVYKQGILKERVELIMKPPAPAILLIK